MRFISAQFATLLSNDLWWENASHANRMAQMLARELEKIPQIAITQKVESNGVFAIIPRKHIPLLQKSYFFYVWNEETSEVRFMTSFDTTAGDIEAFVKLVKKIVR
jgi:threonine aldolase